MKFSILFKKELREMINLQTILMLVFMIVIMAAMGNLMNSAMDEAMEESAVINLCDLDDTEFTQSVIRLLKNPADGMENEVKLFTVESDDYKAELERLDLKTLVIIPEGFTDSIDSGEQAELIYIGKMTSTAAMANVNSGSQTAVSLIESAVKSALYTGKVSAGALSEAEVTQLNSPITLTEHTVVGDKSAEISMLMLYSAVYNQSIFLPMAVYFLILMGSQSMINAVASEKLDKTLETLLSAPISRLSVISAKMLAAAVVALLNAGVYMVGMSSMTKGVTGSLPDEYSQIVTELGLTFSTTHYILIGVQMLISTLIALSVAIILGAFAKDVKSSQMLAMPIIIITIIPFIAAMFTDISAMPGFAKWLLYIIPFTHTFMASDCVIFGKDALYIGGLLYQLAVLIICMGAAIRVFTSDKIFTASENLFRLKKKKHTENA